MKFEKLNNDKMKITLNRDDLVANDIDLHSFMANSRETQSLFLAVLDKAERDYGFCTDDYHLKVETIALDNGNFILTITRSKPADLQEGQRRKFKVSRKVPATTSDSLIYRFNNFDDFCSFAEYLYASHFPDVDKVSKKCILYNYNKNYYLVFSNINLKHPGLKMLYSSITEFGTYVTHSEAFASKLYESATPVIKAHAIKVCGKYFI